MHILFEQTGIDKVWATQFIDLLLGYKFIVVIDCFVLVFFHFFSYILNKRHPLGGRTKLRNKVTSYFWVLESCKDHTGISCYCKHVYVWIRFNSSEKLALILGDLDLLFVRDKDRFPIIIHKLDCFDWFIIRRPNSIQFSIKSKIINIYSSFSTDSNQ